MNITGKISFGLAHGIILLFCAGCSTSPLFSMLRSESIDGPGVIRAGHEGAVLPLDATGPSHLEDLLALAVRYHPELQSAQANIEAARGRMIQAGLHPNPSIGPNFGQLGERAN